MRLSRKSGWLALGALATAAVLSGCGGSSSGSSPAGGRGAGTSVVVDISGNGGTIDPSQIQGWPSTAPSDVPAFPGTVDNLMVGRQNGNGYGVRIFFSGVTTEEFGAYLSALHAAGYKVQGIVYYSDAPNAEANAQARAARGEYDAVRATKDPRRINISVPAADGRLTYDLDGLTKAENDAMNVAPWPAGWADKVPAPNGCQLDSRSILSSDLSGFRLYCLYASTDQASRDQVVDAYLAALQAKGFSITETGSNRYYFKLTDGANTVTVYPDQGGHMYIEVKKAAAMTNGWPSDWVDSVPPPDGCTLGATPLSTTSNSFNVACTYPDDDPANHQQVVLAYQAKLVAAGFHVDSTERDGSRLPNGVSAINLSKGGITVRVMPDGAPNGMSISATDGE